MSIFIDSIQAIFLGVRDYLNSFSHFITYIDFIQNSILASLYFVCPQLNTQINQENIVEFDAIECERVPREHS